MRQRNIDIGLRLRAPDGSVQAEFDSSSFGAEEVAAIAKTSGCFVLEVLAVEDDTLQGEYRTEAVEKRAATSKDAKVIEAQTFFARGRQEMERSTAEGSAEAARAFEQAAGLYAVANDWLGEARARHQLGNVYHKTGRFQIAHEEYTRALKLWDRLGDESGRVETVDDLQSVLGHLRQRRGFLSPAAKLATWSRLGEKRGEAGALVDVASRYSLEGDDRHAMATLERALALWRSMGQLYREAGVLEKIGKVHSGALRIDTALEVFRASLEICRKLNEQRCVAALLSTIGDTLHGAYRLGDAIPYFEQAIVLRHKQGDRNAELAASSALADIYLKKGDLPKSLELSRKALAMREELRRDLSVPKWRIGLSDQLFLQERLIEVLMSLEERHKDGSYLRQAFETVDRAKGRFLLESAATPDSGRVARPLYESARALLDGDTALLEFHLSDPRGFVWQVTSAGIQWRALPHRDEIKALTRQLYDHLTARNQWPSGESPGQRAIRIRESDRAQAESARALGNLLLTPIVSSLSKKRLLIVGDGILQHLPFGLLPGPDGQPLVQNHEIMSLPSISAALALQEARKHRPPPNQLLAVLADPVFDSADPRLRRVSTSRPSPLEPELVQATRAINNTDVISRLFFSGEEAKGIVRQTPSDGLLSLVGFDASREALLDGRLAKYRIVHLSTHGFLNDQDPDLSGLVFSLFDRQGRRRKGFFRMSDLYELKLPADLVVLSACQTALGKLYNGEGSFGLPAGFLRAGAGAVVSSAWKIDDEATAALMNEFYRGMFRDHLAPSEALRKAQLHISRQPRWRAPYYWAGMLYTGLPLHPPANEMTRPRTH